MSDVSLLLKETEQYVQELILRIDSASKATLIAETFAAGAHTAGQSSDALYGPSVGEAK